MVYCTTAHTRAFVHPFSERSLKYLRSVRSRVKQFSKPKMPKSKEYVSDTDSSSEEEVKSKKKQKKEKSEDKTAKDEKRPAKKAKTDDETIWDLGSNRQVNVRSFKGKYYVDIREMYYDKDGDLKPGKKGICLSMPQWRKFMEVVEEVDKVAKSKS